MERNNIYCNKVILHANVNEIVLLLDRIEPVFNEKNEYKGSETIEGSSIKMSPQIAKSLAIILSTLINQYENKFGEIGIVEKESKN